MSVSPSDPSTSPHSEVVKELRADHTPARVRERLAAGPQRSYLRDAVYGAVDGAITTMAVEAITEDEEGWIDLMVTDELGLSLHPPSAWRAGLTTFVAFVLAGLVPLLPFVVERLGVTIASPIVWSVAMTGVTFVAIGAIKARFVLQPVWRAAAETVLLGGAAAFLAYGVGVALGGLVG